MTLNVKFLQYKIQVFLSGIEKIAFAFCIAVNKAICLIALPYPVTYLDKIAILLKYSSTKST